MEFSTGLERNSLVKRNAGLPTNNKIVTKMKRYLSTFFKAVVSIFVYLVARNVDVSAIGSIFKNVSIPFLLWILFMEFHDRFNCIQMVSNSL